MVLNKKFLVVLLGAVFLSFPVLANEETETVDENFDKYENFNRFSFGINNKLDEYLLRPLALGYRAVTTEFIRNRVGYALLNIKEPISAVNHLFQGDIAGSGKNIGRFALNSTLGLFGTFDVADGGFGLSPEPTGFDATMASWCIKDGPFLVLPVIGQTTPRAFVGNSFDSAINPVSLAVYNDANVKDKIGYSYLAISTVAVREANLELIDGFKRDSVDFYATVRSAYLQNRMKINKCGAQKENMETNPDYDFNMDDE